MITKDMYWQQCAEKYLLDYMDMYYRIARYKLYIWAGVGSGLLNLILLWKIYS